MERPIAPRHGLLALLCLFGLSSLLPAQEAGPAPKPNIVLILSDDQSWTDYGFMGHPQIRTPALDKLASQSAVFSQAYVPTALCRPALMTLATGPHSHQNKTTGNNPADTPANARHAERAGKSARERLISHIDTAPTVPKLLADQGYLSFQCGKWWEGSYQRGGFTHQGDQARDDSGTR
jgi:arylsulfatase A-like enzyme